MPRDFGPRFILWMIWSNLLSIICTLQIIVLYLSADDTLALSDKTTHYLLTGANVLGIVIAQVKKNHPPKEAPRKRIK